MDAPPGPGVCERRSHLGASGVLDTDEQQLRHDLDKPALSLGDGPEPLLRVRGKRALEIANPAVP